MLMRSKKLTPPGPDHPIMQGFNKLCPGKNPADGIFVQIGEATPAPRTLKSHLPLSLLPPALVNVGKVWCNILGVSDEKKGYHGNFYFFTVG